MKMRSAIAVGTLAFGVGVGTAGASPVLIDDFTSIDSTWPVQLNSVGNSTITESGLNVLGGTRETYIEAVSVGVAGLDFLQASIAANVGLFDFNSTVDTDGYLSLLYNGGGSLNADFTGQAGIAMNFAMFDFAGQSPMPITVVLGDGSNSASYTASLTAPGAQSVMFDFSDFSGIGMLDLSSLQSIEFQIDPEVGVDFRIEQIMTVVPAPGALALLALAFASPRRRRD